MYKVVSFVQQNDEFIINYNVYDYVLNLVNETEIPVLVTVSHWAASIAYFYNTSTWNDINVTNWIFKKPLVLLGIAFTLFSYYIDYNNMTGSSIASVLYVSWGILLTIYKNKEGELFLSNPSELINIFGQSINFSLLSAIVFQISRIVFTIQINKYRSKKEELRKTMKNGDDIDYPELRKNAKMELFWVYMITVATVIYLYAETLYYLFK